METPAPLLETLRGRLRDVQTKLIELNALRKEEETLTALIRHYESVEGSTGGLPDSTGATIAEPFSIPRRMAVSVRKLLSTDIGPEATVPELFEALPKSLKSHYRAPNQRSNIETMRTQLLTWKDEAGIVYESGKVSVDPNAVPALFSPAELVLRSGAYRCAAHPEILRGFKQDRQFDQCPLGATCSWVFSREGPSLG